MIAASLLGFSGAQAQTADPAYYNLPPAQARVVTPHWQTLELGKSPRAYPFAIYANKNLNKDSLGKIKRIIVIVHGVQRDADRYYETVAMLLANNPKLAGETLIIAPKFAGFADAGFGNQPAWRRASWEDGEESVQATGRPAPISSFQVLDDLLLKLSDRKALPALNSIVLAGHSGGAQLVQRYAVLTMIDGPIRRGGIDLRYVVANPSSYLYLSDQRPRADGKTYARYERGICPTYNQYKYGPEQLPTYSKDTEESKLFLRYAARNVTYLLGDADNNPEDRQMDKSCGAEAQGSTRLARGLGYVRYEMLRATQDPRPIPLRHKGLEVMGVNHDHRAMFGSVCGAQALLGDSAKGLNEGALCKPIGAK